MAKEYGKKYKANLDSASRFLDVDDVINGVDEPGVETDPAGDAVAVLLAPVVAAVAVDEAVAIGVVDVDTAGFVAFFIINSLASDTNL